MTSPSSVISCVQTFFFVDWRSFESSKEPQEPLILLLPRIRKTLNLTKINYKRIQLSIPMNKQRDKASSRVYQSSWSLSALNTKEASQMRITRRRDASLRLEATQRTRRRRGSSARHEPMRRLLAWRLAAAFTADVLLPPATPTTGRPGCRSINPRPLSARAPRSHLHSLLSVALSADPSALLPLQTWLVSRRAAPSSSAARLERRCVSPTLFGVHSALEQASNPLSISLGARAIPQ